MILVDVNPLLVAHRAEYSEHVLYRAWLEGVANGPEPFGLSEIVLAGFVRISTRRGPWGDPTPLDVSLAFVDGLRRRPTCRMVRPGPRHFDLFVDLCRRTPATGKLAADAYHAALAIEQGCEWITADADFARFPGLRWRHPLRPR